MEKRLLRTSELLGIPFIVFAGSLLHFTYQMSGGNPVVAVFSAVNESLWEHLKLAFWPATILAAAQYFRLRKAYPALLLGKTVGILSMPLIIVAGFYGYTLFIPHNLAADIGLFIASVIAGQAISYRIISKTGGESPKAWHSATGLALVAMAALFAVFTFNPPQIELFRDPVTGGFGPHLH
ncbi:MAG: DUF6512 family protein [Nitrososphaerota archaeon]|nr:DUF6512 family protein [Candidatus Calditenuaceae archaeon]MDW8073977.1 DUF6512 family protein [Nitrososphaerota archaeon]